jgi:hypothetical protein
VSLPVFRSPAANLARQWRIIGRNARRVKSRRQKQLRFAAGGRLAYNCHGRSYAMTVAELMPKLQELPRVDKLQLIQWLAIDLAKDEAQPPSVPIVLLPQDQCPYSPEDWLA